MTDCSVMILSDNSRPAQRGKDLYNFCNGIVCYKWASMLDQSFLIRPKRCGWLKPSILDLKVILKVTK